MAWDNEDPIALNFELYEKDGETYFRYKYSSIYLLLEDTGIEVLRADAPNADVYDMRGVRLGKAADMNSLPKGIYIINKKKMVNK